jgi:hypothetical protein
MTWSFLIGPAAILLATASAAVDVSAAANSLTTVASLQQEAQDAPREPTVLFSSAQPLELTITGPIHDLVRDAGDEPEEHEGTLAYVGESGDTVTLDLKLRTRGNFRRQRKICDFPPIRLNLKKGQVAGTLFANQDKLKLVTHCQEGKEEYEQYVLQEYMIYRTWSLFTDVGFQTRLARITYVDSSGEDETVTKYAFLIEDEDELAMRLNAELVEVEGLHPREGQWEFMGMLDVFQYMIGNTDWSVPGLHNIRLLDRDFEYYAVPYDFDFSGVIAAPYAKPDANLRIKSVRDRVFRGFCRAPQEMTPILAMFEEKKEDIYGIVRDLHGLSDENEEDILKYYDDFYNTISRDRSIERAFHRDCRR